MSMGKMKSPLNPSYSLRLPPAAPTVAPGSVALLYVLSTSFSGQLSAFFFLGGIAKAVFITFKSHSHVTDPPSASTLSQARWTAL